jgi:hypothetical protein
MWIAWSSFFWSQSSVVGIASKLWAGWSGVWNLVGTKDIPLFQNVQTGSGAHPTSYSWVPGLFHGGKTAGVWSWTLTSLMASLCEWEKLHLLRPFIMKPSMCSTLCVKANACWNLLINRNLTCCRCTMCSKIFFFIVWYIGESNMHFITKLKKCNVKHFTPLKTNIHLYYIQDISFYFTQNIVHLL